MSEVTDFNELEIQLKNSFLILRHFFFSLFEFSALHSISVNWLLFASKKARTEPIS